MQRAIAEAATWPRALSLGLLLCASFSSSAREADGGILPNLMSEVAPGTASIQINNYSNSALERWRSYALAGIIPDFSWAPDMQALANPPALFDNVKGIDLAAPSWSESAARTTIQIDVSAGNVTDVPAFVARGARGALLPETNAGLDRYVVAPGVSQRWSEEGTWTVSAILAYQRFASLGMGSMAWKDGYLPMGALRNPEGSFGTGIRFDMGNSIGELTRWKLGFQSRVNMDTFNNYRGVFSEPGDFDIPASADLGLAFAITPQLGLDFDVQHVLYNQITPFTSDSLPTRFLALLGDGTSPTFAWRDLTVYSVGWTWHHALSGDWQIRYSTREQPSPTSTLLQQALRTQLSTHSMELSFTRAFDNSSNLRIVASYAPNEYVLGVPTSYNVRDNYGGNQLEVEALWSHQF